MSTQEAGFMQISSWGKVTIGSLGRVVTGKTPPTESREYFNGEYPFVSPKDLHRNSFYVYQTETKITEKALEKFKNQVLPRNAVMFTSLSFAFGKMGITSQPSLTNQQINSIVVNSDNNFRFVYYLLRAYEWIIFSYNSGIDTPIVPKSVFEKIQVLTPRKKNQEKIAAILTAYDDLIENNQRRIALLEKMAEEIYREWFVRMRFPGHEQVKFEKGVPEGWNSIRFGDFCGLKRGYDLPDADVTFGDFPVVASTSIKGFHNQFKVEPPVITTGRSGSLGKVLWVNSKAWPLNTTLYVKEFYGNSPYLIFFLLKNMGLESFNAGAGVPSLNRNHLDGIPMLRPSEDVQKKFDAIIAPIFSQQEICRKAVENLVATRDVMLPRLISGKLSVENLDIQFPPSMQEATDGS